MKDIKVLEIPQDLPVRSYGQLTNKQRIKYWCYIVSLVMMFIIAFILGYAKGAGA